MLSIIFLFFLLIGSSYTAFILLYYPTPYGLFFLKLHWGIIIFGILFKLIYKTRYEIVSLTLYLCLGWMVVSIYQKITAQMPSMVEICYWQVVRFIQSECYFTSKPNWLGIMLFGTSLSCWVVLAIILHCFYLKNK